MKKYIVHLHFLRNIARRLYWARKRFKLLLFVGILVLVSIASETYLTFWALPNTSIGARDVSGMRIGQLRAYIASLPALSYRVRIQNREYTYTYADMGAEIDTNALLDEVLAPRHRVFPASSIALITSFFMRRTIPIPVQFTQDFSHFIDRTVFTLGDTPDVIEFNEQEKTLSYIENRQQYRLDESYMQHLLKDRAGDTDLPLYPHLVKVENQTAESIADAGERIKQMYLSPLAIIIDHGQTREKLFLSEKELVHITTISLSPDQTVVTIGVNESSLREIFAKASAAQDIVTPTVLSSIRDILTSRFDGHQADTLIITPDLGPNTTGALSDKYIEVDISQQKMYIFEHGRRIKEYRVSTGLEYPTPTGEFTVLNKVDLGFSEIYQVWMPWWMGFSYSDELHAYFGIHELPYKLTNGQKIQRPANFIGSPNTGGCVALAVGDAQEVYLFADVGTKVVIYE